MRNNRFKQTLLPITVTYIQMYIPTKTCWLKHWRTNTTANCWDDFHFSRCERWVTLLSHLNGIFTYSVLHLYQDIKFFKTSAALLVCTEGKIGDGDIVRCGYRTRQHVLHQMRNELWVVLLKFNHVSCVALTQRCAVKLKRNIQLIRPLTFFYSRVDFILQETLLQLFQI